MRASSRLLSSVPLSAPQPSPLLHSEILNAVNRSPGALAKLIEDREKEMGGTEGVTALHQSAKKFKKEFFWRFPRVASTLLSRLAQNLSSSSSSPTPQDIALSFWALSVIYGGEGGRGGGRLEEKVDPQELLKTLENHAFKILKDSRLRSQNLSNIAYAIARLHLAGGPEKAENKAFSSCKLKVSSSLFTSLIHASVQKITLKKFKRQELSNLAWAAARLGIWPEVEGKNLSSHLSQAALEKLMENVEGGEGRWGGGLESLSRGLCGSSYSGIVWALGHYVGGEGGGGGKGERVGREVIVPLFRLGLVARLPMSLREMSSVMWAAGKSRIEVEGGGLAEGVVEYASEVLAVHKRGEEGVGKKEGDAPRTSTQTLGNLAWALASLGVSSPAEKEIFGFLESEIRKFEGCSSASSLLLRPQELSNLMWSFSKSGDKSEFVIYLAELVGGREGGVSDFSHSEMSTSLYSLAKAAGSDPASNLEIALPQKSKNFDLLTPKTKRFVELCREYLTSFSPLPPGPSSLSGFSRAVEQTLSLSLWSLTKLGALKSSSRDPCLASLLSSLLLSVSVFEAQSVSKVLYSLAALGLDSPELWDKSMKRLEEASLSPLEGNIVMWACGSIGRGSSVLTAKILDDLRRNYKEVDPRIIATILWGVGALGIQWDLSEELLLDLVKTAVRTDDGPKQGLMLASSLAAQGRIEPFRWLLENVDFLKVSAGFRRKEGAKLWMAVRWAQLERGFVPPPHLDLLELQGMVEGSEAAFTNFHREVLQVLESFQLGKGGGRGKGVEAEVSCPTSRVLIDLAVPSLKLAVECDGPWHFSFVDGEERENGRTQLRGRLLRAAGWKLVNVRMREWNGRGAEGRREYLKKLVEEATR